MKRIDKFENEKSEIVLNLWAIANEIGIIQRLAAKSYVLDVDHIEKIRILKCLARGDFLIAKTYPVPTNILTFDKFGGPTDRGLHASITNDPHLNSLLFGKVMDEIESELEKHIAPSMSSFLKSALKLSDSPLCVTTVVIEYSDGRLIPVI